jgi:hypothetical protein
MNEPVTKPRGGQRVHRSEHEIREILSEYETSRGAMSVSDFCDLYDIGESTFYNWQRRFSQVSDGDSGGFIPLDDLLDRGVAGENPPTFTITLEGGHVLRYHGQVSAGFLRELLGIGGSR